jgi:hypothetical protein
MRKVLVAALIAAGVGIIGATGASAAPANGAVIRDGANLNEQLTQQVGWHGRWRSHWRWGSRWRRWWR